MVCADLEKGVFLENIDIVKEVADRHPYGQWIADESRRLEDLGAGGFTLEPALSPAEALKLQVSPPAPPLASSFAHPVFHLLGLGLYSEC